jgi:DNA repair exonuclease SbcCD nuclease subunit
MKILVIGDPHFKGEEKNRPGNKLQTDKMRSATLDLINERKPDRIVITGDTLDRFNRIDCIAQADAIEWIYEIAKQKNEQEEPVEVDVLVGNHDRPSNEDYMTNYHPFTGIRNQKNIHIINEIRDVYCKELENYFMFIPYVPNGRLDDAIRKLMISADEPEAPKQDIEIFLDKYATVFAHQEVKGAKYNNIVSEHGDKWPETRPLLVLGHIHNYQRIGENIIYVGTPMQHDFGDLTKKTVSLFTYNKDNPKHPIEERISLGLKERKVVHLDTSEAARWKYDDKYLWKLHISGTDSAIALFLQSNKYKKLKKLGVAVHVRRAKNPDEGDVDKAGPFGYGALFSTLDFQSALVESVKNDKRQLNWLRTILKEAN